MSDSFTLVAGLGNPGKEYSQTRHNIGFVIVDSLASKMGQELNKQQFNAVYAKARFNGRGIFLVKPQSYMNRSGVPLQKLAAYYKIDMCDILVIHDDMDLSFGQIKIVQGRGHGGHNGIRSIIDAFGRRECVRVRVGVGHPEGRKQVTGHVLGKFTSQEQVELDSLIKSAVDACMTILEKGVVKAMNTVNSRR